jgi:hypothetical protein
VYVVRPTDPRPEVLFGYPTIHLPLEQIDRTVAAECLAREIEWVLVHSSGANHVVLNAAGEMITGKRKRFSFAPMVWTTGCLMAYEVIREVLGLGGGPGPGGIFINPWTGRVEKPRSAVVSAVRRMLVRRFLRKLATSA